VLNFFKTTGAERKILNRPGAQPVRSGKFQDAPVRSWCGAENFERPGAQLVRGGEMRGAPGRGAGRCADLNFYPALMKTRLIYSEFSNTALVEG